MNSPVLMLAREVDSTDRAIIATDATGIVIYWGLGAEVLYGFAESEVLGRSILEVTPGELSRKEAADIMESLTRGESWSGEFLVRTKDGTRFTAHVTDVPLHDAAGHLLGIIGISRRVSYLGG